MKDSYNRIVFVCLCVVQLLLNNFFAPGQYLLLTFLPLSILLLPLKFNTVRTLFIAFATGLSVDFLSSSSIGISACALLLVALLKNPVLYLASGEELFSNHDASPLGYLDFRKTLLSSFILCALYFSVYVWVDAAGTRPFGFNALRWLCSTAASGMLCSLVASALYKRS